MKIRKTPLNKEIFNRIDKYTQKTESCWLWTGACTGPKTHLYGALKVKGKMYRVHRINYERYREKIPKGLVIDHVCKNTKCVNPSHLRAVTQTVNSLENSESISAKNNVKTHCKHGHEYTDENTNYLINGKRTIRRECVKCRRKWRDKQNMIKRIKRANKKAACALLGVRIEGE